MIESEKYMYQFVVQSPALSMVEIDTGDPKIKPGSTGCIEEEFGQYDSLLIRLDERTAVVTKPLLSASIQAGDLSWYFDVF